MLVSPPQPPRGEGTRSPASPRLPLSIVTAALGALLGMPACYSGTETGEPWRPGNDDGADEESDGGDDGNDGDGGTGGGDAADGADDADDAPADDGADDAPADDGADDAPADDGTDDGEPPQSDDVPSDLPYCASVVEWDDAWKQHELDILELVNQFRATGYNCGSGGNFGPAGPLTMNPNLRCAARIHSKDMNDRNFFDHTNPSGESPFDRMQMAGYNFFTAGENIAGGSPGAAGTMDQWMNSAGHCSNIMNPDYDEIGVGYYPGGQWGTLWTQAFGAG